MARGANTIAQKVRAAQNASKKHGWPKSVDKPSAKARRLFEAFCEQRAFEDWTPADLAALAMTCRLLAVADSETTKLIKEGPTLMVEGKLVLNPRQKTISTMISTGNATLRRLNIAGMSAGEKRSVAARGKLERKSRDGIAETATHANTDGAALM